ncbi:MAG: hypothetical protein AAF371_02725 [Pseudomonadota bacterium]
MSGPDEDLATPDRSAPRLLLLAAIAGAALAFGALALADWLVGEIPGVAAELPGGARRTLSVLRYPAAFVALVLTLSLGAGLIDRLLSRLHR